MEDHVKEVEQAVRALNLALARAATHDVSIKLRVGYQPNATGRENKTRWMYLTFDVDQT